MPLMPLNTLADAISAQGCLYAAATYSRQTLNSQLDTEHQQFDISMHRVN